MAKTTTMNGIVYLMACGCSNSGAYDQEHNPICTTHQEREPMGKMPKLLGRTAKCIYCKNTEPSKAGLAFFVYKKNEKQDSFYCGCYGWD